MTELKAKDCPLCACIGATDATYGWCSSPNCQLRYVKVPLAQWNTRPRERELSEALTEANEVMKIARDVIVIVSRDCRQGCGCYKCDALANYIRPALSSINAALGKGGE